MKINAGWELKSKNKAICRWFIAWDELPSGQIAGAISGFAGGGTFVVERFYGTCEKSKLTKLWIDLEDRISGDSVEFDDCGAESLAICESGLDAIWEWNDNEVWCDTDEVVLQPAKTKALIKDVEMLLLAKDKAAFLHSICELAGLTASPGI